MFSNTEFNHLKLKLDQLYLSLSGGKVNGETVFSKKVTFGSGNKVIKIYDGKIEGLDSPEGHTYDLESSDDKSEVTLTEDGADKTTLPLVNTFVGTRTEWNALSAMDKAKYRIVHFTDEQGGYSDAYDIPYRQTNVGNGLDILNSDLSDVSNITLFNNSNTKIYKNNQIVTIIFSPNDAVSAIINSTVPSGYRPQYPTRFPVLLKVSNKCYIGYMLINTDGVITVSYCETYASDTTQITGGSSWNIQGGCITYVCA